MASLLDQARRLAKAAYSAAFAILIGLVERDLVPDFIVRRGIRFLLAARLAKERQGGEEAYQARQQAFVNELKGMPIAIETTAANEQHYEVPTKYFLLCLGRNLKYSSCLYPSLDAATPLDDAEEAMLGLTCARAELADGQRILELGCGWGSLSLHMAARYPRSQVTAVSNSRTQKQLIDARARERGLRNLTVVTANVVGYEAEAGGYDRVVSVEMFEHMKNYKALLAKVARALKPGGLLFVHHFAHTRYAYHFEVKDEDDWMAKHFFSGGTMPSAGLLHYFQDDLAVQRQWFINGRHYSLTLEAWLRRQDSQRAQVMPIMAETYGQADALKWWVRWRLFYLACSELFRFNRGEEWGLVHLVMAKK